MMKGGMMPMKKTGISIATILMMTVLAVTGCGTKTAAAPANNTAPTSSQPISDQDKAMQVAKDVVAAFTSYTYKDHASFDRPGQFMVSDLAEKENKYAESFIPKYDANHAVAEHGPITATLKDHKGDTYVFEVKTTSTIHDDVSNKELAKINTDDIITVQKQTNGQFLVTAVKIQGEH
jgi:predicted small lipoprotein YifL